MARKQEPSFRINKLDLIIALLTAHVGLGITNPVLVPHEPIIQTVVVAILVSVSLTLSAAWNSKKLM